MDKKPPKTPSPIKRDANNNIDPSQAAQVTNDITRKLITESRDYQREMSMRNARTNRRDVIVKFLIYQRNTVNGIVINEDRQNPEFEKLSDDPLDPYLYKYFDHVDGEIFAKEMPMPASKVGRWTMGCFKAVVNYLARMNVFNNV